jgi:putative transposon-encoded protein
MNEVTNKLMNSILSNKEISNKILNSFKEYLRFQESLLKEGLTFKKKVTKFSNTSAAIYLPKRLIGRTFKVLLMPIDEIYEISEPMKEADKVLKETEKELENIQKDNRKNLLEEPK